MTFFKSGGRPSYFAWFIATTKIEFDIFGAFGALSRWYFAISCSLIVGTISHGTIAPSITPFDTDSGTCGTGIWTGVAPIEVRNFVPIRVGARTFNPLSSSRLVTCLLAKCRSEPSCRCVAISLVPLNSSSEFFCTYSHSAGLPVSALFAMNGNSNTSDLIKRPA